MKKASPFGWPVGEYHSSFLMKDMKLLPFVPIDGKVLTNSWKILMMYSIIFLVVVTETGTSLNDR